MEKAILYKDHPVFYHCTGKGEAVMLIHGFAEDHTIWKHQAPVLEKQYTVITPDMPGSGGSKEWADVSMEGQAEVVRAILQQEQIEKATVIGHSMGGYITLAFAEKYPEMLKAFGLFHSTAFPDTEEKKVLRRKSIEFIRTHGAYEFLKQSTPNTFSPAFRKDRPEVIDGLIEYSRNIFSPEALIAYYEAMISRLDRTEVLKTFPKAILFIMGLYDMAVPLKDSYQQCHLPVLSYIHVLKASGHSGLWEEPAESNRILLEFLGSS